ncbi:hypothetical protein CDAR_191031 [Caerostris darwini]|uniref:Uncharacterized protein n=1 Tax=Caerostris darwini TaxID=1538125 RepID=A0AAV4W9C4_9ARAC|nr:hypothetical protein CDAR_191031 [Caerostris darwini]
MNILLAKPIFYLMVTETVCRFLVNSLLRTLNFPEIWEQNNSYVFIQMSEPFKNALRGKRGSALFAFTQRQGSFKALQRNRIPSHCQIPQPYLLKNVESSTDGDDVSGVYM